MKNINNFTIHIPDNTVDAINGEINGKEVLNTTKYLKELVTIFEDKQAFSGSNGDEIIYQVQAILPVKEGVEGGLYYGKTIINPGKIGNEYYMTKGHFHRKADRAEFYWGIQGEGVLLLMDKERNWRAEKMFHGSLHYIDGYTAHRTINIGDVPLIFGACWPSDAGHDFQEIIEKGFPVRLKEVDGQPTFVNIKK